MSRPELPPGNRVPQNTAGLACLMIEEYHVGSWGPLPDGKGPSTEVHLSVRVKQIPYPLVIRFKTADAVDLMIAALQRHRADVWPTPGRGPA